MNTNPIPQLSAATLNTSIVICAYTEERWDVLVAAIESAIQQDTPPDEVVIVIDHNPRLLERVHERFPQLVVIENSSVQGLSGARNTGVAASHGRLIGFLDDDAVATPDWFGRLVKLLDDPAVLGVGSHVGAWWMVKPPRWFPLEFYWTVGCSYRGQPTTIGKVRNPTGGAMCIRRECFEQVGNFRIGIGRVGKIPLGCEETELCIRIHQHWPDRYFLHDPAAIVKHQITAPRATWRYFRSRCYAEGLSKALVSYFVGAGDGLQAERSHALKILPSGVLIGLRDAIFRLDVGGLGRATAIVAGTLLTGWGYVRGRLSPQLHQIATAKG